MKQYKMWVGVILVAIVVLAGLGFFFHLTTNKTLPNTLYTAKLSEEQKAQLTTQYKLDINSTIFETKFKVTDNIKNYIYYVELYQHGAYKGTYVENFGNFSERQGSIVTAFSINRGEDDTRKSLKWTSSFIDGGYCSYPNVAFPNGFTPSGVATSTIASAGADGAAIVPETPIILANIGFHGESNTINSYDCEYLMENPSAIAEYECVYLVKCIFSEKDELELEKAYLNSETATTIQPQAGELGDLRPMVMINGILYLDTGEEGPMGDSGAISGTIKSTVGQHEKPTEHEQSNFGAVGSSYADGGDFIQVNIDDKWIVFEAEP